MPGRVAADVPALDLQIGVALGAGRRVDTSASAPRRICRVTAGDALVPVREPCRVAVLELRDGALQSLAGPVDDPQNPPPPASRGVPETVLGGGDGPPVHIEGLQGVFDTRLEVVVGPLVGGAHALTQRVRPRLPRG